jgi:hypothetical protein
MGADQSRPGQNTNPQHQYSQKMALFSNVFSKMLQQADIIDIRALTSGPGACGSYVLLLQENIAKEFKTLKIASKNDVKEFAFAKRDSIESISDTEACTNLALFYIRALQFVAAIMLSVYSPPELLPLLRNKIRKEASLKQKIVTRAVVSPQQTAQMEQMRDRWFRQKFLKDTQIPNIFTIDGDEQLSYDNTHDTIMYNDFTTSNQYKANLRVEELDTYNIKESDKNGRKYWITITHPLNGNIITRRLISEADSSALVYSNIPSLTSVNTPISDTKPGDWTSGLSKELIKMPPSPIPYTAINPTGTQGQRTTRKIKYNNASIKPAQNTSSTLPTSFQNSYDMISKWFSEKDIVMDVNPAAYRSLLLYNSHIAIGEVDSTNMAADFWQNMGLNNAIAFSTLETLFNDGATGSMSVDNKIALETLAGHFNDIYSPFVNTPLTNPKNLSEVLFPDFKNIRINPIWQNNLKERLYDLSDSEGRTRDPCPTGPNPNKNCWPPGFNQMLIKQQKDLQQIQAEHLDRCIALLQDVFTIDSATNTVYFTDKFLSDVRGAKEILEDYIVYARKLIGDYYVDVETRYYEVVKKIAE